MRRATLNHTYKLKWDHVKRIFVAVAEIANGQSKKGGAAMLLIAASIISPVANALEDTDTVTLNSYVDESNITFRNELGQTLDGSANSNLDSRFYGYYEASEWYDGMPESTTSIVNDGTINFGSFSDGHASAIGIYQGGVGAGNVINNTGILNVTAIGGDGDSNAHAIQLQHIGVGGSLQLGQGEINVRAGDSDSLNAYSSGVYVVNVGGASSLGEP